MKKGKKGEEALLLQECKIGSERGKGFSASPLQQPPNSREGKRERKRRW